MTVDRERPRVAVLPQPGQDGMAGLDEIADQADFRVADDPESLAEALDGAQILLQWDFRSGALAEAWPNATSLEWIHAASAGVDAALNPQVRDSDCILTNAKGVFDRPIAEYVLGVMLAFAKDLPTSLFHQREKRWQHRETHTLLGRRLLVIGAGGIGREIGRLAQAVGMDVTVAARSARGGDPDFGRILGTDDLDTALPEAQAVALCTPLTEETTGMMDDRRLGLLQSDAWFINVGRGQLVQEDALAERLRDGRIGAAALDVFQNEPLPEASPLWDLPNEIGRA